MQKINHKIRGVIRKIVFGILIIGVFSACAGSKNVDKKNMYEILFQSYGQLQGIPSVYIIQSEKELQKLYTKLNMTRMPAIPVPAIDFENETFVVISYEIKGKNKNNVEIQNIKKEVGKVIISLKEIINEEKPINTYYKKKYFFVKLRGTHNKVALKIM